MKLKKNYASYNTVVGIFTSTGKWGTLQANYEITASQKDTLVCVNSAVGIKRLEWLFCLVVGNASRFWRDFKYIFYWVYVTSKPNSTIPIGFMCDG